MGSLQIVVIHPQRKEKNCTNVIFPIVFCSFYVIVSSEAGRSYVAAASQGKLLYTWADWEFAQIIITIVKV